MSRGATSFSPGSRSGQHLGPALVQQVFSAAADEMASSGVEQAFTPVLDLARDPRWGRTEETYGEDPFLGSRIGVAAIQGLQGPNFLLDATMSWPPPSTSRCTAPRKEAPTPRPAITPSA